MPVRLSFLLACALVASAAFQGTRGIYDSTEERYTECAREMAQAGTWLEPVLNGQHHWTKPPLTYIFIGIPYRLFGPTAWAARLYLIPCYLVAILSVWWMTLFLWNDRASANMAALVYATMGFSMATSHIVATDYPLTAAMALTLAFFWAAMRKRSSRAVHLAWLCLGVAFLVKGPPSLLVLPAMFLVWARLPRDERRQVPLFAPSALALFFVVGFGWYAWEAWKHPGLAKYWFRDEVVNRSLTNHFHRNNKFSKNFEIYLPVLLCGTLPWSGWLAFRWRAVREKIVVPGGLKRTWINLTHEGFWLFWTIIIPLTVFVFSQSKLPLYLLPLFVPIAAATGRLLIKIDGNRPWFRKRVLAFMFCMFALFIVGKGGIGWTSFQNKDRALLHRHLTKNCGIEDPKRLAVYGDVHPNGLSYYFNYALSLVNKEGLAHWATAGGRRFVLYSHNWQEEEIEQLLQENPLPVTKYAPFNKWRVISFDGSTNAPAPSL